MRPRHPALTVNPVDSDLPDCARATKLGDCSTPLLDIDRNNMPAVKLGDTASGVKEKCGFSTDYYSAWKSLNAKATAVCTEVCGNVPLNQADTAPAIAQLRTFYSSQPSDNDISWRKIQEALEVDGAAAWIVHNAVKRNFEKQKRGFDAVLLITLPSAEK